MDYFLTIAASDNSGGAGIQQDIKVANTLGYWSLSALTGITVQNFETVFAVQPVEPSLLKSQIEQCLQSFDVRVVKIGAICGVENLKVIAECLKQFRVAHVVCDTVFASTGGVPFLNKASLSLLQDVLFPSTKLITPNKPEFELLTEMKFSDIEQATEVAIKKCRQWNTSILLKGGHFGGATIKEALVTACGVNYFERKREVFPYQHGTGCTLASAIACFLGKGFSLTDSYAMASEYLIDFYKKVDATN